MASRAKLFTGAVLMLLAFSLYAQEPDCKGCHKDVVFASTAHTQEACTDCHTNVPPDHEDADLEPLTDEQSCGDCHRRPLRTVGRSVHDGEAQCAECHGDPHRIHLLAEHESAVSSVNQIKNCASCHDEPPGLIDGYLASVHGRGLFGLQEPEDLLDCARSGTTMRRASFARHTEISSCPSGVTISR